VHLTSLTNPLPMLNVGRSNPPVKMVNEIRGIRLRGVPVRRDKGDER
jgi:hypothetical protein